MKIKPKLKWLILNICFIKWNRSNQIVKYVSQTDSWSELFTVVQVLAKVKVLYYLNRLLCLYNIYFDIYLFALYYYAYHSKNFFILVKRKCSKSDYYFLKDINIICLYVGSTNLRFSLFVCLVCGVASLECVFNEECSVDIDSFANTDCKMSFSCLNAHDMLLKGQLSVKL